MLIKEQKVRWLYMLIKWAFFDSLPPSLHCLAPLGRTGKDQFNPHDHLYTERIIKKRYRSQITFLNKNPISTTHFQDSIGNNMNIRIRFRESSSTCLLLFYSGWWSREDHLLYNVVHCDEWDAYSHLRLLSACIHQLPKDVRPLAHRSRRILNQHLT